MFDKQDLQLDVLNYNSMNKVHSLIPEFLQSGRRKHIHSQKDTCNSVWPRRRSSRACDPSGSRHSGSSPLLCPWIAGSAQHFHSGSHFQGQSCACGEATYLVLVKKDSGFTEPKLLTGAQRPCRQRPRSGLRRRDPPGAGPPASGPEHRRLPTRPHPCEGASGSGFQPMGWDLPRPIGAVRLYPHLHLYGPIRVALKQPIRMCYSNQSQDSPI